MRLRSLKRSSGQKRLTKWLEAAPRTAVLLKRLKSGGKRRETRAGEKSPSHVLALCSALYKGHSEGRYENGGSVGQGLCIFCIS